MTSSFLFSTIGLAVLGFDPLCAVIAVASVLAGVRTRHVGYFITIVLLGTPVLGIALALSTTDALQKVSWHQLLRTGIGPALIELAAALVLLGWLAFRLRRKESPKRRERPSRSGAIGQCVLGVGMVAAWLPDPVFLANVALGGSSHSVTAIVVGQLIWTACSQAVLIALLIAAVKLGTNRVVSRFDRFWSRCARLRTRLLNAGLAAAAALLAIDGCWYLVADRYLIAG
ncbi:MAG: hypothetical protein M3Z00_10655 [Actinomycetota bacterium]|nr:hypothetical protein [Actinomycetota bacterium]